MKIFICIIITIRCETYGVGDTLPTFSLAWLLHIGAYDYWNLSC